MADNSSDERVNTKPLGKQDHSVNWKNKTQLQDLRQPCHPEDLERLPWAWENASWDPSVCVMLESVGPHTTCP